MRGSKRSLGSSFLLDPPAGALTETGRRGHDNVPATFGRRICHPPAKSAFITKHGVERVKVDMVLDVQKYDTRYGLVRTI